MGLLSGGYHPSATPLISASVEPNQRGRALGFHLIGGNASFFLSPIIAGVIASAWSWRGSFIGLAIPTCIFGLIFYWHLHRRSAIGRTVTGKQGLADEKPPPPGNKRRISAFIIMTILSGGLGMSVISFLSLFAVDELGASEQTAASSLSFIFFAGLWASPVGGYLSDRVGRVPIIVITTVTSGILVYSLQFTSLGVSFYALLVLIGICNAFRMPVSEAFIMGETSASHRSTIYGFYYFAMQYTGAIFAPILGQVIDKRGFDFCFTVAGLTSIAITATCSFFLRGSQS
jgi:MFS family permease